jgi:methionine-gamma-lyase
MDGKETVLPGENTRLAHDPLDGEHIWWSHVVPIFQSNTFYFEDSQHLRSVWFEDRDSGYIYSRSRNPTVTAFERKMAALEGADKTVATASGMAAISAALLSSLNSGDHVVASDQLYPETEELLEQHLVRFGIGVTRVAISDLQAVAAAIQPATKVLYTESISNPFLIVANLPALRKIADQYGLTLIVDNTFASPILLQALELGAHLSVHSATKLIGGHGSAVGGTVSGDAARIGAVDKIMRLFGGCLSPFNAWLIMQGMKTMKLRVERQCENALQLARFLQSHPLIENIYYPGLDSHPQHELAGQLMRRRYGSMIAFEPVGGKDTQYRIFDNLRLCYLATSLGDVSTLVIHRPIRAVTRISVGIEEPEDLIADWKQALDRAKA